MELNEITDNIIANYLLGKLNTAEQQQVDEQLGEPEFYDAVTAVEARLVDDYVLGRLPSEDRQRFEQRLLRTERQRERVRVARAFFTVVEAERQAEKAPVTDTLLRSYLLGTLSDAEQQRIDEELTDPEFFDAVTSIEDRLMDDYVLKRLTSEDRQRFERRLLRTERQRERVRLAKAFFKIVDEANHPAEIIEETPVPQRPVNPEPTRSWWQSLTDLFRIPTLIPTYGMAAAALLMLVAGAFFAWEAIRMRGQGANAQEQLAQLQQREQELVRQGEEQRTRYEGELQTKDTVVKQAMTKNEELQKQIQGLEKSSQITSQLGGYNASVVTVPPPTSRGGSDEPVTPITLPSPINVDRKNGLAIFNVRLDEREFDSYRAVVSTATGTELVALNQLKARQVGDNRVLVVSFPAAHLTAGNYILKVSGSAKGKESLLSEYRFPLALK